MPQITKKKEKKTKDKPKQRQAGGDHYRKPIKSNVMKQGSRSMEVMCHTCSNSMYILQQPTKQNNKNSFSCLPCPFLSKPEKENKQKPKKKKNHSISAVKADTTRSAMELL
jgi:hypothetical protein